MKSVNYSLRKAYITELDGLSVNGQSIPCYYMVAPESETGKRYMTINNVASTDLSVTGSNDTRSAMQVQIHTWEDGENAGKWADDIADHVLAAIYNTPQSKLNLSADDLQAVSTRLENDITQELVDEGNRRFITRILTFSHIIYHNPS